MPFPGPEIVPSRVDRPMIATEAGYPDLPEWLRELYPFRTRTLQLDGLNMSFVDEGKSTAPVFVLLHGNPTWSFLYRDLIQHLRSQYRVLAPDWIGFGLSDKPDTPTYHSLGRHISNFVRFVEALELHNITLVMNGWGGPIGLGYATTHAANLSRLVFVNSWGTNLRGFHQAKMPLGIRIATSGPAGRWLDSLLNLSMHSIFSSRTYRPIPDLAFEAYNHPFRNGASRAGIAAFMRMSFNPDAESTARLEELQAGLKNIIAPADILWGARDLLLGKLPAYLLRDGLKNSRQPVFLPDVAHYLPEEAPEALANLVLNSAKETRAKAGTMFKILT